ncbi:carbohydrate esterase family 9 protein [Aplosporella prunicola CBS 121167]|uniref:N-acetylglucosamine-6-phosphate deacetylase n=1 Tax=Aplosporella prunicola CBS 121167 TaxID=1176127 RepID=A0A6A6BGG1_9PEZI|nr:carbohydrate esterase family 9 protein [Aplosporella prunicola CBS 121167]KAF2143250.1 carbohydrate esterase family 9 protein [Aplosporella prunicola CBS 121167]
MGDNQFTTFTNCRYCLDGALVDDHLVISEETGKIIKRTGYIGGEIVDLEGNIIAPGLLELHTNGVNGFHFTHFENNHQYELKLKETAEFYVTQGVTGFWATLPTVPPETFQKILPSLAPHAFPSAATLLGAHVEGPYLSPHKPGAHTHTLFHTPASASDPLAIYGPALSNRTIKLCTLAPELEASTALIRALTAHGVVVSLGHSVASYSTGLAALAAGATGLTHTLNAMAPLESRAPGLAGLLALPDDPTAAVPAPYYSLIADGQHLAPATLALLYRAAPHRALLVSDSIELAGPSLPAGTYPGHAQIPHPQVKITHDATGALLPTPKAVLEGAETLVGGCAMLRECVRNVAAWSGSGIAGAVAAATENVAKFMGVEGAVGSLREGRRADLCVLNEEGEVLQTWVAGRKVWEREGGLY